MTKNEFAAWTLAAVALYGLSGCEGHDTPAANGSGTGVTQSAPQIATQPENATAESGQTATFTVAATGTPAPTYQWACNGSPISGATSASYTTPLLTSQNDGDKYAVVVSNSAGSVTSTSAILTVAGSSTSTSSATATLSQGVVLLTSDQEAAITTASATSVTFSEAVSFPPGAVVLGASHVFKVVSSAASGSGTMLTVTEPNLGDLFTSLKIQGTYTTDSSMLVRDSFAGSKVAKSAQQIRDTGSASDTFTFDFDIGDNGFSVDATLTDSLAALIDYDFEDGALQKAVLNVTANNQLSINEQFNAEALSSTEKRLGVVNIPIPLSVLDATLRSLGIYTLAIQVPVYAGIQLQSGFQAEISRSVAETGAINLSYDPASGPAVSSSFAASYAPGTNSPSTDSGVASGSLTETGTVYVRIAPALAFVNSLALLGVDTRLSVSDAASLTVNSSLNPPYCESNTISIDASANGFFKAIGISPITTPTYTLPLYNGRPQSLGSCPVPVKVSSKTTASQPLPFRASVPITVTVAPDPANEQAVPSAAPSGSVAIVGAGTSCQATLSATSATTASGTCDLSPLAAGPSVPMFVTYSGDSNYSVGSTELDLNISDAQFSLMGSIVTLVEDEPLNTARTQPATVRIGPGISFSSGNLVDLSDSEIIGSTLQVGANYIEISYSQAEQALTSSFNGPVFTFGTGAPDILGCSLNSASSFSASEVGVSCSSNQVFVNGSGIITMPGSVILIDLQLGQASN